MALKPEYSVMGGLAVMTMVYAVHSNATPAQADIRALPAGQPDIDKAEKAATWTSAGIVAGVSLLAKDPTIFMMGVGAIVVLAVWTRHSNYTDSGSGRYMSPSESLAAGTTAPDDGISVGEIEPYEMFQGADEFSR